MPASSRPPAASVQPVPTPACQGFLVWEPPQALQPPTSEGPCQIPLPEASLSPPPGRSWVSCHPRPSAAVLPAPPPASPGALPNFQQAEEGAPESLSDHQRRQEAKRHEEVSVSRLKPHAKKRKTQGHRRIQRKERK